MVNYNIGKFQPLDVKINKQIKYKAIENKLTNCLNLLAERYKRDNCGISWALMKQKCMKWGKYSKITGFKGSCGWLNGSLTWHVLKIINLHGEADDFIDE